MRSLTQSLRPDTTLNAIKNTLTAVGNSLCFSRRGDPLLGWPYVSPPSYDWWVHIQYPVMAKPKEARGHDTRYVQLQKNYCFACGTNNPDGMKLKFSYDEKSNSFVSKFKLGKRYTGPPGHCHGGIIATILDEAMGKVNKVRQVIALTSEITVKYLKPVPLRQPLRVVSREVSVTGRKHTNMAEILNEDGQVLARSLGLFIAIDPTRFAEGKSGTSVQVSARKSGGPRVTSA